MARATKRAVKKTSARSKPKAARTTSAKKVKRATTRRSSVSAAARKTATARTSSATSANKATANAANVMENAMSFGANSLRDMLSVNTDGQLQDNILSAGQKGVEQMAKSADAATRSLNSMMEISKENMEACVECSNIAATASKHMGAEWVNYANKSFSQNIELSKEFLSCRTLNDMFDLQSKFMKANLDNFFSESVKMSEMAFEAATTASEPLNETLSQTTDKWTKTLSEAA